MDYFWTTKAPQRKIVLITYDYQLTPDDPHDYICGAPGEVVEVQAVIHYHYYRIRLESVKWESDFAAWQEREVGEEITQLGLSEVIQNDWCSMSFTVDFANAKLNQNWILNTDTMTPDFYSVRGPTSRNPQRIQFRVHCGESLEDYAESLRS